MTLIQMMHNMRIRYNKHMFYIGDDHERGSNGAKNSYQAYADG